MVGGCHPNDHERVSKLALEYRNNYNIRSTAYTTHGGTEGSKSTASIDLETDEYVIKVEIGDFKKDVGKFIGSEWTRVGYIKFTTNKNQKLECGAHHVLGKSKPACHREDH